MLKFAIMVCAVSTICVFMFFLSCGEVDMAGVHSPYNIQQSRLGIQVID